MSLRGPLVIGLMLVLARSASAQKAEADAAFRRGRELMAKGDTAAACTEFETSMRLEALNGTLYNLALCHEQLGKIASAWTEFKTLADSDTNAARQKDSAKHAAVLEKKLTRMHIEIAASTPGLVVKRNDIDVTALAGQDIPVDPGHYTFVASAPNKQPVTIELDLKRPGETVAVAIPDLQPATDDATPPAPTPSVTPFAVSPYALPQTLRPLALPRNVIEAEGHLEWADSSTYPQDPVDTVLSGRMGFGRIEAQLRLAIHTRYSQLTMRPTLVHRAAVGASYLISPLFTAGIQVAKNHILGGDIDKDSSFSGALSRKLIFTPKVAVIGSGGFSFETYSTRGSSERSGFALAGLGIAQFAPIQRVSIDALAAMLLNIGGTLHKETLDLDVGAGISVAADTRTDIYVHVQTTVAPSTTDRRTVLFGVMRRFP
jgi:hypothetical protein